MSKLIKAITTLTLEISESLNEELEAGNTVAFDSLEREIKSLLQKSVTLKILDVNIEIE